MGFSSIKHGAFSLVELLVAISILAIVGALAFPALQQAALSSKRAACASNLRQIGAAFGLYAADHDGCYPPLTVHPPGYSGEADLWSYALWPYVYSLSAFQYPDNDFQGNLGADRNIFHCPVTKAYPAASFQNIAVPNGVGGPGIRMSYAMNDSLPVAKAGNDSTPFKASLVQRPAETALVMECYGQVAGAWAYHYKYGLIPHQGGANFLFCDGHVDWIKYSDVPAYSGTLATFWDGH